ncbi:MAG: ADP-ribosylglycohydrolase family protein [Planctomycetota bacterium]
MFLNHINGKCQVIVMVFCIACWGQQANKQNVPNQSELKTTLAKAELQDKIKGGWAGKVIGCTFGGPTEFRYNGTMIQDYQPLAYDDIYVGLTYVDVYNKEGLQAPVSSLANAFAHSEYDLWYSFQAARYHLLGGMTPPSTGHWLNNLNSEDIGFQIAADFAGLMSPGMVNTSSTICDKVGHISHYGDGWYGGVYVAAMYSLAFVSDDMEFVVTESLNTIPEESTFHQCISDVIGWWKQYPDDWKQCWFECHKKWSPDLGHPDFVFSPKNMDAKLNAAYVVLGLLYGNGDFGRTMELSTRCGQDSDCNPSTAGGILGTMIGYDRIPEYWKSPVHVVEDMDFKYTEMSLNDVYSINYKLAVDNLKKNKATISGDSIHIPVQKIEPVRLEIGYQGHFVKDKVSYRDPIDEKTNELVFDFKGNGFALSGYAEKRNGKPDYTFQLEMYIDGELIEQFKMPTAKTIRRNEVAWKFQLPEGKHQVKIKLTNPKNGYWVKAGELVTYSSKEVKNRWKTKTEGPG